jgi:hypothetical protein
MACRCSLDHIRSKEHPLNSTRSLLIELQPYTHAVPLHCLRRTNRPNAKCSRTQAYNRRRINVSNHSVVSGGTPTA